MPHVRRFNHVGLTVADLDVVTAFFVALGLEVEGRTFVEGEFLDTVCGIPGSRTEIVMLKPPGDGTAWSCRASCDPIPCRAHRPPWPTSWDCATWPSRSATCRRLSIGQLPRAMDWSVASASTKALGGWPTSGGRKGSSSRWPSASAEPRNACICRAECFNSMTDSLPGQSMGTCGGVLSLRLLAPRSRRR